MASKLFAPFKKFPQQLPIFKKSSDKFKDGSMANYNSICGMMDEVTCNCYDNDLCLFAVGTKKGEIKIYGFPGIAYSLINSPLKPVTFLKFLKGQGRLISVTNDNEILLWEYRIELSTWEMVSSVSLSSHIQTGKITSIDVSQSFSWKSTSDDLLELLVVGSSTNKIFQILIIGNRLHLFDGDDLSIDSDHVISKIPDLEKTYDLGGVDKIQFNPDQNSLFYISFCNGLLLILESKIKDKEENKENDEVIEKKSHDENLTAVSATEDSDKPSEATGESKSPEYQDVTSSESPKIDEEKELEVKTDEVKETTESEAVKSKADDEIQKSDEVKPEIQKSEDIKPEIKKLKESTQVPYAHVQLPTILKYVISEKKILAVNWANDKIAVAQENSECINFYEFGGDSFKITEADKTITIPENFQTSLEKFSFCNVKNFNLGLLMGHSNEKNILIVLKDDNLSAEIETPSNIIDFVLTTNAFSELSKQSHTLLILCESQLIAIDIESENLNEIDCPYLSLNNTSHITSLTSIIQVPASFFPSALTVNELFKDWPFKIENFTNEKHDDELSIDIFGTGHADGTIKIWQALPSGVLNLLIKVESSGIFHQTAIESNVCSKSNGIRKQVGCHLIDSEDNLLHVTNIQLMLHSTNSFSESLSNELFCLVGNSCGTVLVFKYDGTDSKENLVEISCNFDKESIIWNDCEIPELLSMTDICEKLPKLNYIVKLNPSFPVTALAFQPAWELLSVGCTNGLVLVDFHQSKCVFSHLTIQRISKSNNVGQTPLTVGQQLKKSIRQSFRKLKKLKPATKHTYTVNEEKAKDKEENKPVEKEEDKEIVKQDDKEENLKEIQQEDGENIEEKDKEVKEHVEETDNAVVASDIVLETTENELLTVEVTRKERPLSTVGSLLIVYTSLSSSNKVPCLFAGTNAGAIFAFEISFEDDTDNTVTVKLSKELHLQHKAPIILLSIINSNHVPFINPADQIGSYQRKIKNSDNLKSEDEKIEEDVHSETKVIEGDIGPSGDSENKEDAKQKSGTLPSPVVQEENIETTDGARRSVDSSKDKINLTNINMKKSGTLPASFLQAIGKSQGSSDSHEFLVVSEEQVKLFSLPSLKAKYKYKVVDTGHHFSHSKVAGSQETEQAQDKKNDNATAEVQTENMNLKAPTRRISSVGLCKVRGLKATGDKWSVSVALTNGEIIILHISNLKKYLSNVFNYSSSSILAGISSGELNLIISYTHKFNIQITDFSQNNVHRFEPPASIPIPKSARPVVEVKVETDIKASEPVEVKSEPVETEPIVNGHDHEIVNGHEDDEEKDQMGDEAVVQNASAVHHGDITMDSIKEYITNIDGNVTIKTFESTKEKQINVDGGQIVTTIHEKQIKDGEIIKDDVVKITSDTRGSNELSLKE